MLLFYIDHILLSYSNRRLMVLFNRDLFWFDLYVNTLKPGQNVCSDLKSKSFASYEIFAEVCSEESTYNKSVLV